MRGAAGEGSWADGKDAQIVTTRRTYTDSDGTLITEVSYLSFQKYHVLNCHYTVHLERIYSELTLQCTELG